jgi:alpha-glucosidase
MVYDKDEQVYQVPEFVVPRPTGSVNSNVSQLEVTIEEEPFSFAVLRKENGEEIFNTKGSNLIFETQYWRLKTSLPSNPSLYGLGEHTDSLRLQTSDYVRTMWARDAGAVPEKTNLYGTHPVYYENRIDSGFSHAVLLLNSNGMDIKINDDEGQYLEYNVIGGVIDLYFMAGPCPMDVARQYSEITQKAAMMPYWGLGFHQCRFGYESVEEVEEVVAKYSKANIPLETMWTGMQSTTLPHSIALTYLDIDYMDKFKVFTLGEKFKLSDMRDFIDKLHVNNQRYIVLVDPAVAAQDYPAYNNGLDLDIFLKKADGSIFKGKVWPGVTAFPDWFHSNTQSYWDNEFAAFFDAETGVDIDALWIDMNEPANFVDYPHEDTEAEDGGVTQTKVADLSLQEASSQLVTPQAVPLQAKARNTVPQPQGREPKPHQEGGTKKGLPGRDLLNPSYKINNHLGPLSNRTAETDLIHEGEWTEYDTHNM